MYGQQQCGVRVDPSSFWPGACSSSREVYGPSAHGRRIYPSSAIATRTPGSRAAPATTRADRRRSPRRQGASGVTGTWPRWESAPERCRGTPTHPTKAMWNAGCVITRIAPRPIGARNVTPPAFGCPNGERWCGDNLAILDQLGRGIGPGSTIHRRGGHTQEPDLRNPRLSEIRDRALAQAPVGVTWQLGSGIDGKLFPHQRPPLRFAHGLAWQDVLGWREDLSVCLR